MHSFIEMHERDCVFCTIVGGGEGAFKGENDRFPCIHDLIHLFGSTPASHVLGLYNPWDAQIGLIHVKLVTN